MVLLKRISEVFSSPLKAMSCESLFPRISVTAFFKTDQSLLVAPMATSALFLAATVIQRVPSVLLCSCRSAVMPTTGGVAMGSVTSKGVHTPPAAFARIIFVR